MESWKRWSPVLLSALAVLLLPLPQPAIAPVERTFRVEAAQFAFSPGVITVNPGDRVTIELVATDVAHGLYIDGYGLDVRAEPGQTARLQFIADRSGTFRLRCSVTCGGLHPFMVGKMRVGTNLWLWRGLGLTLLAVLAGVRLTTKEFG